MSSRSLLIVPLSFLLLNACSENAPILSAISPEKEVYTPGETVTCVVNGDCRNCECLVDGQAGAQAGYMDISALPRGGEKRVALGPSYTMNQGQKFSPMITIPACPDGSGASCRRKITVKTEVGTTTNGIKINVAGLSEGESVQILPPPPAETPPAPVPTAPESPAAEAPAAPTSAPTPAPTPAPAPAPVPPAPPAVAGLTPSISFAPSTGTVAANQGLIVVVSASATGGTAPYSLNLSTPPTEVKEEDKEDDEEGEEMAKPFVFENVASGVVKSVRLVLPKGEHVYILAATDAAGNSASVQGSIMIEEMDTDGDGVTDSEDAFPRDPAESADTDGDKMGNNADPDDDNDRVTDSSDNCPLVKNNSFQDRQADTDKDSEGDACDPDDDNDGLTDEEEALLKSNPKKADTDGDKLADKEDNCPIDANNDPVESDEEDEDDAGEDTPAPKTQLDSDEDGAGDVCDPDDDNDELSDADEVLKKTDPLVADTDEDDALDGKDAFPLDPKESVDTDNDGKGNNADKDDDGDRIGDKSDNCPLVKNNDADDQQTDSDDDGDGDACDTDDDDDGLPDVSEDTDGDEKPDTPFDNCPLIANNSPGDLQLDLDGDGEGNACDEDDDGDGLTDAAEIASVEDDEDEEIPDTDPLDADSDDDGVNDKEDLWPDDSLRSVDTDGDGTDNIKDKDDDGDGVQDKSDNCPLDKNPRGEDGDQPDNDGDDIGDPCDPDDDNDFVPDADGEDADGDGEPDTLADNCPLVANGPTDEDNQTDTDGDGIGNACDDEDEPVAPPPAAEEGNPR